MRLAALERGPPPAAPPPATANNAVGGGVGGTFHARRHAAAESLADLCAFGAGRALLALLRQWAAANESTGVAAEGGLLQPRWTSGDRLWADRAAVFMRRRTRRES